MEPADERREHVLTLGDVWVLDPLQWSPPVKGGSTHAGDVLDAARGVAAMEPAGERREHGSQNLYRLTWANRSSCERSEITGFREMLSGLVKVQNAC